MSTVSVVLPRSSSLIPDRVPSARAEASFISTRSRSSSELVRFPLWPSATVPQAVGPRVGCAFSQVLPPVVE